jgi:hypothetical protein
MLAAMFPRASPITSGWARHHQPEEADRDIPKLLALPVAVRFLSMEPLLGRVDLRFHIFSEPTGNFRTTRASDRWTAQACRRRPALGHRGGESGSADSAR